MSPLRLDGSAVRGAWNSWALMPERAWWSWQGKSGAGGQKKPKSFIGQLAMAKARSEPRIPQRRVEQAWRMRCESLLACAAGRAFASSLLEVRSPGGADGPNRASEDVVQEFRFSRLG